jgi:hypothetical protein
MPAGHHDAIVEPVRFLFSLHNSFRTARVDVNACCFSSLHIKDAQRERKLLENYDYFGFHCHTSSLQHTNLLATFLQEKQPD